MSVSCAVRHYGGDIADAAGVRAEWEGNWLCNGIVIGSMWGRLAMNVKNYLFKILSAVEEEEEEKSCQCQYWESSTFATQTKKTEPSNPQEWLWWNTLINDVWCGFTNYTENFHIFQDLESFFCVLWRVRHFVRWWRRRFIAVVGTFSHSWIVRCSVPSCHVV